MTKTLRKNSKALTSVLDRENLAGQMYTLENSFRGQPIVGQALRDWFARFYDDISVRQNEDTITLRFHSNCWVEIPT